MKPEKRAKLKRKALKIQSKLHDMIKVSQTKNPRFFKLELKLFWVHVRLYQPHLFKKKK